MKIYLKNDEVVGVSDKFIYHVEIYAALKNGIALYEEKWYASSTRLKFKKNILKRKTDKVIRLVTLDYAPQSY